MAGMPTITLEIPDSLLRLAQEQAELLGYDDAPDYLAAMLSDLEYRRWTKADLEAELLKSLDSGTPVVADDAFWADVRARFQKNLQRQRPR
jgi:hypothetical protein